MDLELTERQKRDIIEKFGMASPFTEPFEPPKGTIKQNIVFLLAAYHPRWLGISELDEKLKGRVKRGKNHLRTIKRCIESLIKDNMPMLSKQNKHGAWEYTLDRKRFNRMYNEYLNSFYEGDHDFNFNTDDLFGSLI